MTRTRVPKLSTQELQQIIYKIIMIFKVWTYASEDNPSCTIHSNIYFYMKTKVTKLRIAKLATFNRICNI